MAGLPASKPLPRETELASPEAAVAQVRQAAANRLIHSLLHDVRNPLNALAINAEVLTERLKDASGALPEGPARNLKAIRDQVQRVDGVLRQFATFLAPPPGPADCDLSALVQRAVDVLGHESRRQRVRLSLQAAPELRAQVEDLEAASFLILRPMLWALERGQPGSEVRVSFEPREDHYLLQVRPGGDPPQAEPQLWAGLLELARRVGWSLEAADGVFELRIPQRTNNFEGGHL